MHMLNYYYVINAIFQQDLPLTSVVDRSNEHRSDLEE